MQPATQDLEIDDVNDSVTVQICSLIASAEQRAHDQEIVLIHEAILVEIRVTDATDAIAVGIALVGIADIDAIVLVVQQTVARWAMWRGRSRSSPRSRPRSARACRRTACRRSRSCSSRRVDAQHGRYEQAIAGLTKVVEFYDGRGMRVAAVVRSLLVRSDVDVRAEDLDSATSDATRALEVAQALQGGKAHSSLTGQSLLLMARIQKAHAEESAAREKAGEAVAHLVATLGDAHPDTRRAREYSQTD